MAKEQLTNHPLDCFVITTYSLTAPENRLIGMFSYIFTRFTNFECSQPIFVSLLFDHTLISVTLSSSILIARKYTLLEKPLVLNVLNPFFSIEITLKYSGDFNSEVMCKGF